jgi:Domain of unknown function (DUF4234)
MDPEETTVGPTGKIRSPLSVILLSIITLGIYHVIWQYLVFKEMKDHSGEGIGGAIGLVLAIFVSIVNSFLMPYEVGHLYEAAGQAPPVRAVTGFWTLIPLVGWIIWVVKVQGALNRYWESRGAGLAGTANLA